MKNERPKLIFNSVPVKAFFCLVALQILASDRALCDTDQASNSVVAVSIDEIKSFGILTNGNRHCNDSSAISIYEDSSLRIGAGFLPTHNFVKFERLSEMTHIPYWAPRKEHRLKDGEEFKVRKGNVIGWIDDEQLMTYSSVWRERSSEQYIKVTSNTVACIYSSGQYSSSKCCVLTIWRKDPILNVWKLQATQFEPISTCLYQFASVDKIQLNKEMLFAIQLSSIGGDAEDRWGTFAYYLYNNFELQFVFDTTFHYDMSRNYTSLQAELSNNSEAEPVAVLIRKSFQVTGGIDSHESPILKSTDTTIIELLQR